MYQIRANLSSFFYCSAIIQFFYIIPPMVMMITTFMRISQLKQQDFTESSDVNSIGSNVWLANSEETENVKQSKDIELEIKKHISIKKEKKTSFNIQDDYKEKINRIEQYVTKLLPFYIFFILNIITYGSYVFCVFVFFFWLLCILLFNIICIFNKLHKNYQKQVYSTLQKLSNHFHHLAVLLTILNYLGNNQQWI